jgi:alanine-glyoxylate transaminase/serine-glyoxylate transaminase/serine-pyruvate transaminase
MKGTRMTTTHDPTRVEARAAATPPPLSPPERLLMGPGPSNPDPRVLAALGANPVGHLDPYFIGALGEALRAEGRS